MGEELIKQVLGLYNEQIEKSKGKKDVSVELEMSLYKLNQNIFVNLYKQLVENVNSGDAVFELVGTERILDILVDNLYNDAVQTTYRREMKFSKEGKLSEVYMKKVNLMKRVSIVKDVIDYKIKVSVEEKIKEFSTPLSAKVRIKVRTSFMYKENKNWRFDLTMVKYGLLSELGPYLGKIKGDILTLDFSEKNIFEKLPLYEFNVWEVEVEWVGKDKLPVLSDISIMNVLFRVINAKHVKNMKIQEYIYEIAKEIESNAYRLKMYKTEWGLKKLLNQVIGLTKQSYRAIYPPIGMYVTEKTDGFRCLVRVSGNRIVLIFKDTMIEKEIDGDEKNVDVESIFDGEILLLETIELKLFDVIKYKNKMVGEMPGRQRLEFLKDAVSEVERFLPKFVKDDQDMIVEAKKFELITESNIDSVFKMVYERNKPDEREGLIIMAGISSYERTKNYKWKDFAHNTIDFLVKKLPSGILGTAPFLKVEGKELCLLFVGINSEIMKYMGISKLSFYDKLFSRDKYGDNYQPIQFNPSSCALAYLYYHDEKAKDINGNVVSIEDNTIIELRIDHKLDRIDYNKPLDWKFVQLRTDRTATEYYFGNDYEIAETTFQNYIAPFELEDLSKPDFGYFAEQKSNIHEASNKFKRYIGQELIFKYGEDARWVLDLGGGRGGDLQRYQAAKVRNILFIDIDAEAINELILRKYSTFKSDTMYMIKNKQLNQGEISTSIYTLLMDLNQNYKKSEESIKYITGNASPCMEFVMSNFAFHYFYADGSFLNMVELLKTQVVEKGIVAFTVMDGAKVFERLKDIKQGEYYKIMENGVEKYSLKKNYGGVTFTKYGQTISVKMPFSSEHYEESLVNIPEVIKLFEVSGFKNIEYYSFKDKVAAFKKVNKTNATSLTKQDLEYIELFSVVVFKRQ